MNLIIFIVRIKILYALHLKHYNFWPSADVKPMQKLSSACRALAVHVCYHYVYSMISMAARDKRPA
jgi:hypothetical protein